MEQGSDYCGCSALGCGRGRGSGSVSILRLYYKSSDPEEITDVQGQKNPNKTVGTGAAVRRYPTPKGKGEAPVRW